MGVDKYVQIFYKINIFLYKCMCIIIAAIQNNEKTVIYALGALPRLVCCDQGSTAHVCCCCFCEQILSDFVQFLSVLTE